MLIEQIINERYVNLLPDDTEKKRGYTQQVWDLLQKSYAPIGGIKGSGFQSPEDMINIPMWKLGIRDGKVRVVSMYKDRDGRKIVALGTDGSRESVTLVNDMLRDELSRSYGENSKAALGKLMKLIPWDTFKNFIISPNRVAEMRPQDRVIPISEVPEKDWPDDAKVTLAKYPQLKEYGYLREISPGSLLFKVMVGTPGKNIR